MIDAVWGIFAGLLGLLGLLLSANALDDGMYVFGLGLAGFGLAFGFWLARTYWDRRDRAGHGAALRP
jgi:hypothetical protein